MEAMATASSALASRIFIVDPFVMTPELYRNSAIVPRGPETTGRRAARCSRVALFCGSLVGLRYNFNFPRVPFGTFSTMTKFVFVTGGVVSSLGKGIAAASLAAILESRGLKVTMLKLDPYINVDPGTMSPMQHGEVF